MADLSDVTTTIYNLIIPAVYPAGVLNPSIVGVDVFIMTGWPIRTELDKQLKLGNAMVSVYPTNKEKDVTKFQRVFQANTKATPTLTASVVSTVITIGGTVTVPQAVVITVNKVAYAYKVLISDTTSTIATALAALIPGAVAVGAVITISGLVWQISARIATAYSASEELKRQERVFQISCWCPTPTMRDTLAAAIDVSLAQQYRVPLADNFYGYMRYSHTTETDNFEKSLIYRRDLFYMMQYATTITETDITIITPFANVTIVDEIT